MDDQTSTSYYPLDEIKREFLKYAPAYAQDEARIAIEKITELQNQRLPSLDLGDRPWLMSAGRRLLIGGRLGERFLPAGSCIVVEDLQVDDGMLGPDGRRQGQENTESENRLPLHRVSSRIVSII